MKVGCSIKGCKEEKHYGKGLCNKHYQKQYQKSDKYKQYQKQYQKQKAINDLAIEVEKYDWIKDKEAMILDGKRADKRMKELRNPKDLPNSSEVGKKV